MGRAGDCVNAAIHALVPFLIGVGAAFVLVLAVGLVGEEGLDDEPAVASTLDQLSRAAMIPVLALSLGIGVLTTVLFALREVITSRALAKAATGGALRTAVPHPSQVDLVARTPFLPLLVGCGFLGGFGLLFTIVAVVDFNSSEMGTLWGVVAVTLACCLLVLFALAGRRGHRRRRLTIAAHWTTEDERAAWRRAAPAPTQLRSFDATGLPPELQARRRVATRCELIGVTCFAFGFGLLELWLFITHPFRSTYEAGPRVEYGATMELILSAGIWVFAALIAVAVALLVVGFIAESAVQHGEQRILREALDAPTSQRPPSPLIAKYSRRRPVVFAQALALLAAIGLTLGWTVYSLGTGGMEDVASLYGGADETFGGLVPQAMSTILGSTAALLVAIGWDVTAATRGYELRSDVVRRWPVKPPPRMVGETGKKKVDPTSAGPSLTPVDKEPTRS